MPGRRARAQPWREVSDKERLTDPGDIEDEVEKGTDEDSNEMIS
jgi:hypothetical protein